MAFFTIPVKLRAPRDNCGMTAHFKSIGIVGAGAMGRGIAQIAAQAGSMVTVYDANASALLTPQMQLQQAWVI